MLAAPETLAVDLSGARALKFKANSGDPTALRDAAKQFEAMMITQMLKTLRETRFNDEDDPMTGGESMKLYQGLLDQQWAARMTEGRGLGFADMLARHLERQAGVPAGASERPPSPPVSPQGAGMAPLSASPAAAAPAAAASVQDARPASLAAEPAATSVAERKRRFLDALRPHAEAAEAATGVPARFILAQAALESGWGERQIRAADGTPSHNLFGIKAGKGWTGEAVETDTTEYRQGVAMKLAQRFRAYPDYAAAFADHAQLLRSRYAEAVRAGDDAAGFARGLAQGGYATDPAYAGKLQSVIASVAMAGV